MWCLIIYQALFDVLKKLMRMNPYIFHFPFQMLLLSANVSLSIISLFHARRLTDIHWKWWHVCCIEIDGIRQDNWQTESFLVLSKFILRYISGQWKDASIRTELGRIFTSSFLILSIKKWTPLSNLKSIKYNRYSTPSYLVLNWDVNCLLSV